MSIFSSPMGLISLRYRLMMYYCFFLSVFQHFSWIVSLILVQIFESCLWLSHYCWGFYSHSHSSCFRFTFYLHLDTTPEPGRAGISPGLPLNVCLLMDGAMIRVLTGKLFALVTWPHCGRCCVTDSEHFGSFVIFQWSASGLAHTQSQPLVLEHLQVCFPNHSNYLSMAQCHIADLNQHWLIIIQ